MSESKETKFIRIEFTVTEEEWNAFLKRQGNFASVPEATTRTKKIKNVCGFPIRKKGAQPHNKNAIVTDKGEQLDNF